MNALALLAAWATGPLASVQWNVEIVVHSREHWSMCSLAQVGPLSLTFLMSRMVIKKQLPYTAKLDTIIDGSDSVLTPISTALAATLVESSEQVCSSCHLPEMRTTLHLSRSIACAQR